MELGHSHLCCGLRLLHLQGFNKTLDRLGITHTAAFTLANAEWLAEIFEGLTVAGKPCAQSTHTMGAFVCTAGMVGMLRLRGW